MLFNNKINTRSEVLIPKNAFLIEHRDITSSLRHWFENAETNISSNDTSLLIEFTV
jgi:hypothetical protein